MVAVRRAPASDGVKAAAVGARHDPVVGAVHDAHGAAHGRHCRANDEEGGARGSAARGKVRGVLRARVVWAWAWDMDMVTVMDMVTGMDMGMVT
eukprot:7383077-Prymnesium_polylepis.2